jgi:hypothetical protein
MFMILDNAILQGQPHFRTTWWRSEGDQEHHVRFVYIDPWVSSVSGGLRLQNTQDARRAIDPVLLAEHHIALGARSRTSEQRRR